MKKQTVALLIGIAVIVVSSIIFLTQSPAGTSSTAATPSTTTTPVAEQQGMTAAQVATHNTASDCYTIVSGNVYNLTTWINKHPGGAQAILGLCGKDGTAPFTAQHGSSRKAQAVLATFLVGKVIQ